MIIVFVRWFVLYLSTVIVDCTWDQCECPNVQDIHLMMRKLLIIYNKIIN